MHPDSRLLEIIQKIEATRQITRADQTALAATLRGNGLITPAMNSQIQQVYDRFSKGLIRLAD